MKPLLTFSRITHTDGHTSIECVVRESITIPAGAALRLLDLANSAGAVAAVVSLQLPDAVPAGDASTAPAGTFLPLTQEPQ